MGPREQHLVLVALLLPGLVVAGYFAQRKEARTPRAALWTFLVAGVAGVERLLATEAPALRMSLLSGFAFLVCKVMVGEEERADGMPPLSLGRWLAFAVLWVGMRPRLFVGNARGPRPGARDLLVQGAIRLAAGLLLIGAARLAWSPWGARHVATALLGGGLLLVFHFGACTMLAAVWRARGVRCEPIVRAPVLSQSLTEFWSRRWNLAYSEMCAIVLYRPLAGRVGRRGAVFATFLFSGLLHEMAISLPVRAGFGLPLLYFVVHGVLVLLEDAFARRGRAIRGLFGLAWSCFWLLAPLPLLFHPAFVHRVLWPLVGIPA